MTPVPVYYSPPFNGTEVFVFVALAIVAMILWAVISYQVDECRRLRKFRIQKKDREDPQWRSRERDWMDDFNRWMMGIKN